MAAIPIVLPPLQLYMLPVGTCGVSFNLITRETTEDLPDGRDLTRIHEQFAQYFADRLCSNPQGSVFLKEDYNSFLAYTDVLALRALLPLDVFATVLRACRIFHIRRPLIMDVTNDIRLGSRHSPALLGPTPAGLVPDTVPYTSMDHVPDPLPVDVQPSHAAFIGNNWAL